MATRGKTVKPAATRPAKNELYYATHYHLVPLYIICGILIVGLIILTCYVRMLWTQTSLTIFRPYAAAINDALDGEFLAAVVNPADKKQYIPSANIRFTMADPYAILRYSYDPGDINAKNSATIGITTSGLLHMVAEPLQTINASNMQPVNMAHECSKLYLIRFVPGVTPYGGFTPLKDVKLADGRTAYIHKNTYTACQSLIHDDGSATANLERALSTIESY